MTLPSPSNDRILQHLPDAHAVPHPPPPAFVRGCGKYYWRVASSMRTSSETEVRKKAIRSQIREGLHDPYSEEPFDLWELRLERVRDALTDFYFAYNLLYEDFESLVRQTVGERGEVPNMIYFNPELAPQDMLFEQAELIERLPPEKRKMLDARLQEIKVVLIRTMISDQLGYIKIARKWFTIDDLKEIRKRKIGYGKIGGKSAGMLLAYRILRETASPALRAALRIPVSYFLASDVFYSFMATNGLVHWSDQKYKPEAQMRAEFPIIQQEFRQGRFPEEIAERLRAILREADGRPLIVRSSSLLEDNFGTSFAGKYESFFCPNQGTEKENLRDLTRAITQVYASGLNPNALLYRHHKGLVDYDERLAVLIQFVEGERMGRYFLPQRGIGVGFSRNLYRWSPQIRREDGLPAAGVGPSAPAPSKPLPTTIPAWWRLSHPLLHPASSVELISRYSQKYVDVIDLEENALRTVPLQEVLDPRYPPLRYIAQIDEGGYLSTIRTSTVDTRYVVVTFDEMLRRTAPGRAHARNAQTAGDALRSPGRYRIYRARAGPVQRPARHRNHPAAMPPAEPHPARRADSHPGRTAANRYRLLHPPHGAARPHRGHPLRPVRHPRRILPPALRRRPCPPGARHRAVEPGAQGTQLHLRWAGPLGNFHPGFGRACCLWRYLQHPRAGGTLRAGNRHFPEPSFGTHFFQDLMEANIYPLAIYTDDEDVIFNRAFFYETPNRLAEWYLQPR